MSRQRKPYPKTCKTNSGPSPPPQLSSLTVKKTVYSARNGAPKKAEELYLCPFVSKKREMVQPMPTKAFLQPAKGAATCTAPRAETHPPPPNPPFLLAQNLSPIQIATDTYHAAKVV